ncbi:MAG: homocysteine S-methyltransferase family protein [Acidobacteria bacterium]|nr:homocysteine S-methyltransferase family protein [Acidobacteriota bacterium]
MIHPLIRQLTAEGPVATDGAWGTELQARGLEPGECPDAWNLTHPDRVQEVARAYVEAGCRLIMTNTFQANRIALDRYGLAERAGEINRAGAAISRRAAEGRALVFASLGPSGKLLDEFPEQALYAAFAEQARSLAEGGAGALVVETMSDLAEARIAIGAARETGLPVVASMVFDTGKNKDRTMMGVTPERAAEELTLAGADAVGANCGAGIAGCVSLCRRLRAATGRPIWIKPNAGLPRLIEGRAVYTTTPEEFAGYVPALIEAGASFIGGCCGTGPAFIAAVHRVIVQRLPSR